MMNYLYAAHDDDADRFSPPFIAANDKLAFRTFCFLYDVANAKVVIPSLFRIGVFNDETGCLEPFDPENVSDKLKEYIATSFYESLVEVIRKEMAGDSE